MHGIIKGVYRNRHNSLRLARIKEFPFLEVLLFFNFKGTLFYKTFSSERIEVSYGDSEFQFSEVL